MARISAIRIKAHKDAVSLLENAPSLSFDDKIFVLDAFEPGAAVVADAQTYFTPATIAQALVVICKPGYRARILDLGAGIGTLSFWFDAYCEREQRMHGSHEFVCIEQNPRFVQVGRKILPKAQWVEGSIFDRALIDSLGKFDLVIGNPPFGKLSMDRPDWLSYSNRIKAHFMAVEVALYASRRGAYTDDMRAMFILPQTCLPWRTTYQTLINEGFAIGMDKFKAVHPHVEFNPTSFSADPEGFDHGLFKDTNIAVELVNLSGHLCTEPTRKEMKERYPLFVPSLLTNS